jgi:hypothetical protein
MYIYEFIGIYSGGRRGEFVLFIETFMETRCNQKREFWVLIVGHGFIVC